MYVTTISAVFYIIKDQILYNLDACFGVIIGVVTSSYISMPVTYSQFTPSRPG